jgi:Domain of Unknown Function (DUF1259)
VTALHNHLLRAQPATYYMHVLGHGDPVSMATAIRAALAESGTPFAANAPAQENNIEVTAIHSHMLGEQPRLFFVHFWANDEAVKLARGLRAALDKTDVARS